MFPVVCKFNRCVGRRYESAHTHATNDWKTWTHGRDTECQRRRLVDDRLLCRRCAVLHVFLALVMDQRTGTFRM